MERLFCRFRDVMDWIFNLIRLTLFAGVHSISYLTWLICFQCKTNMTWSIIYFLITFLWSQCSKFKALQNRIITTLHNHQLKILQGKKQMKWFKSFSYHTKWPNIKNYLSNDILNFTYEPMFIWGKCFIK